jgi:hypothetical protein
MWILNKTALMFRLCSKTQSNNPWREPPVHNAAALQLGTSIRRFDIPAGDRTVPDPKVGSSCRSGMPSTGVGICTVSTCMLSSCRYINQFTHLMKPEAFTIGACLNRRIHDLIAVGPTKLMWDRLTTLSKAVKKLDKKTINTILRTGYQCRACDKNTLKANSELIWTIFINIAQMLI